MPPGPHTPGPPPSHPHGHGHGPGFSSVAAHQAATAQVLAAGKPTGHSNPGATTPDNSPTAPEPHPDDALLSEMVSRYDALGDEPPMFTIAANDSAHASAHTIDRHGPDLPLPRQQNAETRTVEGRIYGDHGWPHAENKSYKWTDHTTMNREVNRYIAENWAAIRENLAMFRSHDGLADAGHRVGVGYYNKGMYGAGPRTSEYSETSTFRVRIELAEGTDPPDPFIVSAFPAGLG